MTHHSFELVRVENLVGHRMGERVEKSRARFYFPLINFVYITIDFVAGHSKDSEFRRGFSPLTPMYRP